MNSKFINALMFTAGAAIGSVVTWKIVKTRYERIVQEEIESVKEVFSNVANNPQEPTEGDDADDEDCPSDDIHQINWDELENLDDGDDEDDLNDYERVVKQYTTNVDKKGGADDMTEGPYVISPYDFGELDDYSQFELTYYADGTLEDEDSNIITDIDELLGKGSLDTFGDYEEDAVFVRNDHLRADFQILKDYRTYEEARSIGPKRVD